MCNIAEVILYCMEQKYKSLTIFEFHDRFPDEKSCMDYLTELKWSGGFECPQCKHTKFCSGHKTHIRQCTQCNYLVSPTSGTLFHKVKFPLLKAFYIVYFISTSSIGISSTELSRKLGLRQKTCWLFKLKVMQAMKSSGRYKIEGNVEVDETVVGGQEEGVVGRKNDKKQLVVFAVERKGKGISRLYGKVIPNSSAKELGAFMKTYITLEASVKTDEWSGYTPLKKEFVNLKQVPSGKKGENFPDLHRVIMGFKGWLRGVHHHAEYLQAYIDEYTYRFNRNFMKEKIFDNLMKRMITSSPCTYKNLIA